MKISKKAFLAAIIACMMLAVIAQPVQVAEASVPMKSFIYDTTEGKVVVSLDDLVVALTSTQNPLRSYIYEGESLKVPFGFQDDRDRYISLDTFISASTNNIGKSIEAIIGLIDQEVPANIVNGFLRPKVAGSQITFEPIQGVKDTKFEVIGID